MLREHTGNSREWVHVPATKRTPAVLVLVLINESVDKCQLPIFVGVQSLHPPSDRGGQTGLQLPSLRGALGWDIEATRSENGDSWEISIEE
jgi:hypothetical protein